MGADRLRMPSPTIEQFVDAVKHTVVANKQWVIIYKYFITMIYKSHDIYWKMLLIINNLYKNIRTLLIINLLLNSKPYCVQGSSMRIVLCLRQFYVLICMYACMYVLRPHKYITYLWWPTEPKSRLRHWFCLICEIIYNIGSSSRKRVFVY